MRNICSLLYTLILGFAQLIILLVKQVTAGQMLTLCKQEFVLTSVNFTFLNGIHRFEG